LDDDNEVNVADLNLERNIRDAVSHAIAIGANFKLETTFEMIPNWKMFLRPKKDLDEEPGKFNKDFTDYEGGPVPDGKYVTSFKNPNDYDKWKIVNDGGNVAAWNARTVSDNQHEITDSDSQRYATIFREFHVSDDPKILTKHISDSDLGIFSESYAKVANVFSDLLFKNVNLIRKIEPPLTKFRIKKRKSGKINVGLPPKQPFIFLFDKKCKN